MSLALPKGQATPLADLDLGRVKADALMPFQHRQIGDRVLLSNDLGDWAFVSQAEFRQLLHAVDNQSWVPVIDSVRPLADAAEAAKAIAGGRLDTRLDPDTDTGLKAAAQGPALKFLFARGTQATKRGAAEAASPTALAPKAAAPLAW